MPRRSTTVTSNRANNSRVAQLYRGVKTAFKYRRNIVAAGRKVGNAVRKHFKPKKRPVKVQKIVEIPGGTAHHSGLGVATIKVHQGKPKRNLKTIGKWEYHIARVGYVTSPTGEQSGTELNYYCTPTQMCGTSTIAFPGTTQSDIGLLDMNPYCANTGSRVLSSTINPLEDRFYLKGFQTDLEISNMSVVGAFLEIRLLRSRRTSDLRSPNLAWNEGYSNQAFGQTSVNQPGPGTGLVGTAGGYGNLVDPGASPKDSAIFNQFWEVVAQKNVQMVGGSTERVKFDVFCDRVIKKDVNLVYIQQGSLFVSRQTYCLHIVCRGAVVNDNTTALQEIPTYGSCKLGYVLNTHYHACAVKGNASRLSTNRAYLPIPFGATPANQSLLNENDVETSVLTGTA